MDQTSVMCDWDANAGRRRIQLLLLLFRLAQRARRNGKIARLVSGIYRLVALNCFSVDLPAQTRVGVGLQIHHGFGIVVNGHSVIGERVVLRQGVTLGARYANDDAPTIGDNVSVGPGAVVLGRVTVGHDSVIGAGALVLHSHDSDSVLVGNPARNVRK